ncbi:MULTISPECIES: PadR family transcriptional regulator [Cytobacillus]|uniref:Transcriptional regulator n=1 Tax=Cytobacillus kochii TaxID=859143 RepID=A0A248TH27_9BACI|nr:helix-turn-helix transcriptional regulator [Cytobacillus kochii]ASV67429.1 transcriptional regulator [Cytobacillus kochii]
MSIQIFILSKLMNEDNYPYNIKKLLSEPVPLDKMRAITESKLYYHFDSLAKQGLIEVVKVIKEVHRPDKQVYRITEKGRLELPKKIYKVFEDADTINDMILGIANLNYVNPDKVIEIIEKKIIEARELQETRARLEILINNDKDHRYNRFLSNYFYESIQSNIYWLEKLLSDLKKDN